MVCGLSYSVVQKLSEPGSCSHPTATETCGLLTLALGFQGQKSRRVLPRVKGSLGKACFPFCFLSCVCLFPVGGSPSLQITPRCGPLGARGGVGVGSSVLGEGPAKSCKCGTHSQDCSQGTAFSRRRALFTGFSEFVIKEKSIMLENLQPLWFFKNLHLS